MALRKARTAALFRKESGDLGKKSLPGQPVGGLGGVLVGLGARPAGGELMVGCRCMDWSTLTVASSPSPAGSLSRTVRALS